MDRVLSYLVGQYASVEKMDGKLVYLVSKDLGQLILSLLTGLLWLSSPPRIS